MRVTSSSPDLIQGHSGNSGWWPPPGCEDVDLARCRGTTGGTIAAFGRETGPSRSAGRDHAAGRSGSSPGSPPEPRPPAGIPVSSASSRSAADTAPRPRRCRLRHLPGVLRVVEPLAGEHPALAVQHHQPDAGPVGQIFKNVLPCADICRAIDRHAREVNEESDLGASARAQVDFGLFATVLIGTSTRPRARRLSPISRRDR